MLQKIELHSPTISAALAALISWAYLPTWRNALVGNGEDLSNALGPVFDLATFSAGVLFAVYVLALSRADGFLGQIFKTRTFRLFHGYVARAIAASVALSFWTAGYMVVGMGEVNQGLALLVAAAWVGATAWTLVSVARVVLIFLVMVGSRSRSLRGKPIGQAS